MIVPKENEKDLKDIPKEVLKDLKPREAVLIFAMVGFWLRTHPGRKPLDGPVDMLLPHG